MIKALKFILTFTIIITLVIASGCSTTPKKKRRYKQLNDGYPTSAPNLSRIKNADPRIEAKSKIGNPKKYVVFNKQYHVLHSSKGYAERGVASFYGTKFQGHKTSNGEVYNMYDMSAAHKTLPLPTYVEVKNLDNGTKVIVRVNDRGPFHRNRIIDLSYTAAHKLGMLGRGTARVEVRAIDPHIWLAENRGRRHSSRLASNCATYTTPTSKHSVASRSNKTNKNYRGALILQIGVFKHKDHAIQLARQTKQVIHHPVKIKVTTTASNKKLFKVTIGPVAQSTDLNHLRSTLAKAKLPSPTILR